MNDVYKDRLLAAIGTGATIEDIAESIVKICADALDAEVCTLWRVYEEEGGELYLRLFAAYGVFAPQTLAQEVTYLVSPRAKRYDGVTGRVASTLRSVRVNSYGELIQRYQRDHAGRLDYIHWKGKPDERMQNLLAMPVHLGEVVTGVLKVENRKGGAHFTKADEERLRGLLEPVAVACKWMLLLDIQEQQHIEAPKRFTEELVRPYDSEQLTRDIVNTTAKTLKAELCSLWAVETDASGRFLTLKASFGWKPGQVPRYRLPDQPEKAKDEEIEGMTAWVAARRRPFWANSHEELRKLPSWKGSTDRVTWGGKEAARTGFRSLYAVPLLWRDEVLGVLKVENPQDKHHFLVTDHQKCQLLSNLVVLLLVMSRHMRVGLLPEMAHILRSPVAAIVTNLTGLQEELSQAKPNSDFVEKLLGFAKKATMTVDVISRTLSAQMLQPMEGQERVLLDLPKLLSDWTGYAQQMVPQGVQVKLSLKAKVPQFPLTFTERTWIEIVVFNLLHNAAKYTPDYGVVVVSLDRRIGEYQISIEDQGPGISTEDLPHIFEPGFKKKAPGWPEGTGLGLYTVRDQLKRLGWACKVENRKPHGTRFVISVPTDWRRADAG